MTDVVITTEESTLASETTVVQALESSSDAIVLSEAEQGPPGPPGSGVTVKGKLATLADLPASGAIGDMYVISAESDHGYVWDGSVWFDAGSIQGPKGDAGEVGPIGLTGPAGEAGAQGPAGIDGTDGTNGTNGTNGADGADGPSAYAVAVANGFVGTEAAWLASLIGATGAAGSNGAKGDTGLTGPAGEMGPKGDQGIQGVAGLNGSNGSDGAPGADGSDGVGVPTGGTAGQVLAKASATNHDTVWVDPASGGGSGTVTSVGVSVPTGLAVSSSPITTSGTIAISYAAGYSIPANSTQSNWSTAYGWGNHASAGYLDSSAIGVSVQAYSSNLTGWSAITPSSKQDAITVSATAPASPTTGQLWLDIS